MNLIEESFQNKEEKKKKNTLKIVLVAIFLVVIIIIAIFAYLMYLENSRLKFTLDGKINERIKDLVVIENDGTLYFPIKEIASYLGYESYNGEYADRSEEINKCYIESEKEIANFTLGSNKIYKLDLTVNNADYEYVYIRNPIKAINGVLYTTEEGLEEAFNVSFEYNREQNRMYLVTLPYLVEGYTAQILDEGYTEISKAFADQKAILDGYLIVKGTSSQYGVIDLENNIILEDKYDTVSYITQVGDFLVETNRKVGILSHTRETKVQIIYDNIELMDSDAGLYLAQRDGKYGVLDLKGNVKIYIENEQVGMDISSFEQNNIKNKYILVDNLIPIRKDGLWGLYNKNGTQVVDFEYDSFGYKASSSRDAINLLVIPEYNVLVACKDKKYTLLNSSGEKLFETIADDIYMSVSGGKTHYYITVNDNRIDAEAYLDSIGIKTTQTNVSEEPSSSNENQGNTTEQENTTGNGEQQNTETLEQDIENSGQESTEQSVEENIEIQQ